MIEIDLAGFVVAGGFFGTGAGEKRSMEECQFLFPGLIWNGDGEEAGILVVHVDEIDACDTGQRLQDPVVSSEANPPKWRMQSVDRWTRAQHRS